MTFRIGAVFLITVLLTSCLADFQETDRSDAENENVHVENEETNDGDSQSNNDKSLNQEEDIQVEVVEPVTAVAVTGKQFTEQFILADLLYILLNDYTDLRVIHRGNIGTIYEIHEAMLDGKVDLYIEYTGTAYLNILQNALSDSNVDNIFEQTKQGYENEFGFTWLAPFGFNNTFALMIRNETASEWDIETNSDLANHSPLFVFASDANFYERQDGFKALNNAYGYDWARAIDMESDFMYEALLNEDVDVITGFSTDPRIFEFDLVALEDDLDFFPPYYAAPVIRQSLLDKHPEIADLLAKVGPHLTNEKMTELNARVNVDGKMPSEVARDFLDELDLIAD